MKVTSSYGMAYGVASRYFLILSTLVIFLLVSSLSTFAKGSCFLPGTLITMGNGSQIPIENVKAGDKIISYDKNLKPVVAEVIETESPVRDDYYIITFEDKKELKLTDEHPLYIKSGTYEGWGSVIPEATMDDAGLKTRKIRIGDLVLNIEKKWIRIADIKHINEKVQTYNLKKVDKTNTFFAEGFLAHNKGEPAPPPPPPCPWESPGCFKLGGQKVTIRETVPEEFDYYLPQDTRCDSKAGGCACYAKPVKPGAPPLQKNPDESSAACACIDVSDWNTKAQCCGDDVLDCGRVSTGVLCSIDTNSEQAQWLSSSPNFGDMRYVGCDKSEYLSDGITWFKCDNTFWKRTVDNREYICTGNGRESVVECCGDGACKSRVDGKRLSTGQSASDTSNKTHYCRPDKKFVTDLDVPDSLASDRALLTNNKATCEKAGLKWTGTKCCSEADDPEEHYNDEEGTGGCWNKEAVISIDFVEGTEESVVNFNGEFHGCALEKVKYNKDNDNLLNLVDQHTSEPLIENHEYCVNDPEKNYFCSYTEKWLPTDGSDRTHLSFAPILVQQQGGCCAQEECWDGENCVENQKADPLAQPIGNNSRCIDGEWTNSLIKTSPDGTSSGFCPDSSQCLLNIFGRDESSQCIESGQYVADNYCENGKWSSRTKLLALKLLRMKSGDYTLFCDSKENALNTLQYQTGSNEIIANVLVNLQTNNFCVLKTGSRIIVGASINKDLEEVSAGSFDIFGITECDFKEDDDQYHACDSSNKVWFNEELKSFIYSATPISIASEQDPLASFEELVSNPIKGLIDSLKRLIARPPFDESYIKGIKKFDKLYISQQGNRFVIASMEGKNFKNAVIEYRNFETDVCSFVDQFNQAKKDISSGVSCRKEGNNYYVLAQGSQFTSINPEQIWPDLTSKLRLSGVSSSISSENCFDSIKNQNEIGKDCGGICKACISTQTICQNAQNGDLCAGLDIAFTSGYKNACCKEFKLCC